MSPRLQLAEPGWVPSDAMRMTEPESQSGATLSVRPSRSDGDFRLGLE